MINVCVISQIGPRKGLMFIQPGGPVLTGYIDITTHRILLLKVWIYTVTTQTRILPHSPSPMCVCVCGGEVDTVQQVFPVINHCVARCSSGHNIYMYYTYIYHSQTVTPSPSDHYGNGPTLSPTQEVPV